MRLPNAFFAPMLGLLFAAAFLACTTAKPQPPGEVVVVVTSDMVVPDDIDTLEWSVTIGDAGTPFKDGSVSLSSSTFPATLAIVSGHETPGPVTIKLEGLGGSPRTLRVHREAELPTVPDDGKVRQLVMPLNWLCTHDANPSLSCEAGETCRAGACGPSEIDVSKLRDYAPDGGACFDVGGCIGMLFPGNMIDNCVFADPYGTQVNVFLSVDTSKIGNYGACGIAENCLIPLAQGAPEGWSTTDDTGTTLIILPSAVCKDISSTLLKVWITAATCPPKQPESPTCPEPACIHFPASGACPDWPDWMEYTCSGSLSPSPEGCFLAPLGAPDAGMDTYERANGRWCCTSSTRGQPGSDSLLIDDMTGGPQIKVTPPAGSIAGFWATASDDTTSPLLPGQGQGSLFMYQPAPVPVPLSLWPNGGPMNAACLSAPEGFRGYDAEEYFDFTWPKDNPNLVVSFDVRNYSGIRFLAWSRYDGQPIAVTFSDTNTDGHDPYSTCNKNPDAGGCYNYFGKQSLTLTDSWSEYFVTWDELKQAGGYGEQFDEGFDRQHVLSTNFLVLGAGPDAGYPPFEFCVSQIYFTPADGGADADEGSDGSDDAEAGNGVDGGADAE